MKPSIGRIVIYREASPFKDGAQLYQGVNGTLLHPAVITRVWSDVCVNLMVMFDGGRPKAETSITQLPVLPDGVSDTSGNAGWMWPLRDEPAATKPDPTDAYVLNLVPLNLPKVSPLTDVLAGYPGESRAAIKLLQRLCGEASFRSGWHYDPKTGVTRTIEQNFELVPTRLMLVVSELAEAMEGHRKNLMDDKLPHRTMLEVELADAAIRIFDMAYVLDFDLAGAITEKLQCRSRPETRL